jgi:hypothetical protein
MARLYMAQLEPALALAFGLRRAAVRAGMPGAS